MKTMTFAISDGTFLGSETIVSGSNSTGTHNVYVAFSQAESGTLAIQYKLVAETKWRRLGKVDLTGTEVAEFKFTGQIQDYRFVISNASGSGSIEVSDSEKLEDIHPLSLYGETGGMSPAEIGGAVKGVFKSKKRRVYGRVNYGQLTTISNTGTGSTSSITTTIDFAFTKIRIAVANSLASSVTYGPFKAATLATAPATTEDARNNLGNYVDVSFSGLSTVTIPAAPATDQPVVVWSDWIDLQSEDRSDGGVYPLISVRGVTPSSTTVSTVTANSSTGWQTSYDGRVFWSLGTGTGDYVTSSIESYPGGANPGQNLIIAVEAMTDSDISTISVFGDSVMAGTNVDVTGQGYLYYGMTKAIDSGASLCVENWAWPGRNTTNSLIRFNDIIQKTQTSICVFSGYSTNDGSPTETLLNNAFDRVLEFIRVCNQYNVTPVVVTPLLNTSWSATQKQLVKYYRDKIRGISGSCVVMDIAAVLLEDDGVTFVPGVLADTVHLNQTGTIIAADVAASAYLEAAER